MFPFFSPCYLAPLRTYRFSSLSFSLSLLLYPCSFFFLVHSVFIYSIPSIFYLFTSIFLSFPPFFSCSSFYLPFAVFILFSFSLFPLSSSHFSLLSATFPSFILLIFFLPFFTFTLYRVYPFSFCLFPLSPSPFSPLSASHFPPCFLPFTFTLYRVYSCPFSFFLFLHHYFPPFLSPFFTYLWSQSNFFCAKLPNFALNCFSLAIYSCFQSYFLSARTKLIFLPSPRSFSPSPFFFFISLPLFLVHYFTFTVR